MASDEERDGDRTKITLAAHGDTIEIMPGLGGRIIVSLDDGEGSINALVGVEEQEMVIAAIRRAQGREQGATVPRAGVARVLAIHAQIAETNLGEYRDGLIDLLLSELDKVRAGIDAPAPITVTVRRHQNDFRVYASYAKNRSVVVIDEHPGSWRVLSVTGDGDGCIVKLESWRADTGATLEAAGLWPVAAPGGADK